MMVKKKKRVNLPAIIGIVMAVVIIVVVVAGAVNKIKNTSKPKVALVHVEGPIMNVRDNRNIFSSSSSTENILKDLKKIKKDKSIKAVIIEINSPGGAVVASQEVADAVKNLGKPSIALIRDVGASGAYWVASSADMIAASEVSITGSIGVISSYLEFSDLFEKYGVNYERLVSGDRKDLGTPYRKMDPNEKDVLQSKINLIHDFFIKEVSKNRKISYSEIKKLATGEFYLGSEALENGLIDVIGDKDDVIEIIKQKLETDEIQLVEYKHEKGLLDLFKSGAYTLGRGIGDSFITSDEISFKI